MSPSQISSFIHSFVLLLEPIVIFVILLNILVRIQFTAVLLPEGTLICDCILSENTLGSGVWDCADNHAVTRTLRTVGMRENPITEKINLSAMRMLKWE